MSPPTRGRPTNPRSRKLLTVAVTAKQLELLRKFDYPLSQELVGSARPTDEGFRLRGTRVDVESLVGWVAGEANHARDAAMAVLLNDLADELEAVLAGP
jgi:hypothetical protein